jgi:hypothetical protein
VHDTMRVKKKHIWHDGCPSFICKSKNMNVINWYRKMKYNSMQTELMTVPVYFHSDKKMLCKLFSTQDNRERTFIMSNWLNIKMGPCLA